MPQTARSVARSPHRETARLTPCSQLLIHRDEYIYRYDQQWPVPVVIQVPWIHVVAKTTPVTLWPEATAVATAVRHTWCGQYTTLKRPSSASHVHIHVPRPARHPTHAMNECDDDSPGEQTDQTLLKRVLHTSSMRHAARLAQSSDVPRAPLQHCMRIARTMSVHAHAPRP